MHMKKNIRNLLMLYEVAIIYINKQDFVQHKLKIKII